jgi:predicted MFS family arabinose efflux permease
MAEIANRPTDTLHHEGQAFDQARPTYLTAGRAVATLATLFLINVFSQIDHILPFILTESIKAELGLSDTEMGLLTGLAFALCYTLLSLPLARISDRGSPRRVLIICTVIWSAMTALGGLAASFLFLAFTRFGVAFGEAAVIPAGQAIIARAIRPERRGLAIGFFVVGIPIGTMAGFAAGGAISDMLSWRYAFFGAGAIGLMIAVMTVFLVAPTPALPRNAVNHDRLLQSAQKLLAIPGFRWLFISAMAAGFAAAPFYAFAASFLIRTFGYSASEAGMAFGLLQGLMGIAGAALGGRLFDRAIQSGTRRVLGAPGALFLIASIATTTAIFAPAGWIAIVAMVPCMLSMAFMMPAGFGAAHLVAGKGKEAMATSLIMLGSGLFGPALGPLLTGMISDAAAEAHIPNALGIGLLIVPAASLMTGISLFIANRRVAAYILQS